jgi:GAF domain-containing protein/CheY-like chemotaxis protein
VALRASAGTRSSVAGAQRFRIGEGLVGTVVATRAPLTIANAATDPRTRNVERIRAEGTVSVAIGPLLSGDGVLGALSIGVREPHEYTAEELSVLGLLAGHAANAIKNARLFAEEQARRAYLGAVLEINKKIGGVVPTEPLLSSIAEEAMRLLDVDNAGFRLLEGDDLVVAGLAGSAGQTMQRPRIKVGESLTGKVVSGGRTLCCDIESVTVPEHLAADRRLGYTTFLGVPLKVGDRTIGALTFRARRPFTARDQEQAEAFAGQAALALEHARLYTEATRRRLEAEELVRLARTLTESLEVGAVAERIVESVLAPFTARSSGLRTLQPDGSLALLALGGTARGTLPPGHVVPPGIGISGRALAEGRAAATPDIFADPVIAVTEDLGGGLRAAGDAALLCVPMRVKGRIIGALSVGDRAGRVFTQAEAGLLQGFADQAALALENARLFSLEAARRQQLATLAEIERELAAELDEARLLTLIVDRAARLFAAHGAIYALEEDRTLRSRAWTEQSGFAGLTVPLGQGVAGTSAELRRSVVVNDYPNSLLAQDRWVEAGVRRVMACPLTTQDRLLGVILMNRRGAGAAPFTDDELAVLESFAGRAAIAVENARLYREAREHGDRLAALEEVNRLVSSSLDMTEVLRNIAAAVARFFDAPYVSVWVLDPETRRLTRSLTHGSGPVADELHRELAVGEGAIGWVALHREPMFWAPVEDDARIVDGPQLAARGLGFLTAYPIALGDRVLGAFALHRATPSPVTPETASLLGSLSAQAAVALDNARLYAETTRRLEETRALLEVVEILNSTLDSRQLLKRAAMTIAQVCRVDRCSLELWEGERVIPVMSQYADGRKDPAKWTAFQAVVSRPLLEVPMNARAIETRRPVVVEDALHSDQLPRDWVELFGMKATMAVPMIRQDQVIGVITLDYCDQTRPFEAWQQDLAMTIAGQLALSLENTRLYTAAQERLRETTTLLNVARILSQQGPMAELMRRVSREVAQVVGAEMAGAYFLDARREALMPLAGYRVPKDLLEGFTRRPIVLARVPEFLPAWREGRAVWSPDPRTDSRFDPAWMGALPPHSVLFASAVAHGEPVGGLFLVWWHTGRQVAPAEVRLVEGVAAQVGLAMENAELSRQTQVKLRETETLLSVSRTLSSTLDVESLLRHFLRRVAGALEADTAGAWLREGEGEWMEPVAGYHVPPEALERVRSMRISLARDPFYAEAARTRCPVSSSHVAADPRVSEVMTSVLPHRSQLFVPIVSKERMIGGFGLVWYERAREFSDDELALMEAIANQAGVALENARLFEQNRRQVEELSVLHDLSRAVTGQLDRAALLDAIRAHVARVFDARNMFVILRDAALREFEVALRITDGAPDMREPLRYPAGSVGLVSVVFETRRAVRTDDYRDECARHGVEPSAFSADRPYWLGVPMTADDEVLGVIALRGNARPFSEADERLLTNIAHLGALALRSARLFEERTRAYGELAAAQDQLVRTEKLRALGEMASGMAHDFNNLLASILGRAQLLLQRVQTPQLRQWLQVIERSALDGASTVRRLQEFTRIRRDQPFVAVDLNEIVRDALEITQSRWREEPLARGVLIDVRPSYGDLPRIAGDPAELREALTNLILNAVDAMPSGGVLALTTLRVAEEIVVNVADTGIGIPPGVCEKIFDPFFTTKGPAGTGLGLSMTYGILARHGAKIVVESEEGRGTVFRLTFPVATGLLAVEAPPGAAPAGPTPSLRCLVVDDEGPVGTMLGDVLEAGGHRAVVVHDGGEAIARFGAEPFDLVFTDLAMPRVSGWQVARAIKEMAPTVPIFLITGFGVELTPEERRVHNVDAVLVKPVRIQEILDVVAQVARRRAEPTRTEEDR